MKTLKNNLKKYMFANDMTAQDVVNILGCSRETVYRWMQNRCGVSEKYKLPICELFHVTPEEMFTWE